MMHQNVNVVDIESSELVISGLHCNMHSPYRVDDSYYIKRKTFTIHQTSSYSVNILCWKELKCVPKTSSWFDVVILIGLSSIPSTQPKECGFSAICKDVMFNLLQ